MTFDDLEFRTREMGSTQAMAWFPNGYCASVVQGPYTYGGSQGLYEMAVGAGAEGKWTIVYDTPITDDVLGYLTPEQVTKHLSEIAALPERVKS